MKAVLDSLSVLAILRHWRRLRGVQSLLIYTDSSRPSARLKATRAASRILCGVQPELRVMAKSARFFVNPEAVRCIETHPAAINQPLMRALAASLSASEHDVTKFAKSLALDKVAAKMVVRDEVKANAAAVTVVTDDDHFEVYDGSADVLTTDGTGLLKWRAIQLAAVALGVLALLAQAVFRRRFRFRRPAAFRSELLVHAAEFGSDDGIRREFGSEDYVFDPRRVALLVTEMWRPSAAKLRAYVAEVRRRGISVVDVRTFAVNPRLLLLLTGTAARLAGASWREVRTWNDLGLLLRFVKAVLTEQIFMDNCNTKAVLCRDDYVASHIVRTLVFRQYGVRTFGIQHSAANGLHGIPNIAYVCFDRYLIFGRLFRDLFHPFWEDVPLVEFSYNRIDGLLRRRARGDASGRALPRNSNKKNIVITLPTTTIDGGFSSTFPNGDGMLAFLHDVDNDLARRARILIRPKAGAGLNELRARIDNERIEFLVEDAHTTTELLADADLVIASNGSGVLMECALLQVPMLTYDYFGVLRQNWERYGPDFYLSSADALDKAVRRFVNGQPLDVDWERLSGDLVYPNDGHTNRILERLLDEGRAPLGPQWQPARHAVPDYQVSAK